jgi:hypothetical protein
MTTEVSMSPRAWRGSATWRGVLIDDGIYVFSKPSGCHAGCAGEGVADGIGRHEYPSSKGGQLADRHAIACDDERLAPVQGAHDLSALIAKLALGDTPAHVNLSRHVRYKGPNTDDLAAGMHVHVGPPMKIE